MLLLLPWLMESLKKEQLNLIIYLKKILKLKSQCYLKRIRLYLLKIELYKVLCSDRIEVHGCQAR